MIDNIAFTARIQNANPAQLVVINFELILAFLDEGKIDKARNGLEQLIRSLNFEISLAHDFYDIYRHVNGLLVSAQFSPDGETAAKAVAEARELLETLLVGWQDAEKQVAELPPVAGNAPKVYSGLTYGRDGEPDEYIDDSNKKGYMA
jgi:hypothetical protein